MKIRNLYIVLILLVFTSCENWLDLEPENSMTSDQLYSTGDGFRTALNGLYHEMGTSDLYSKELAYATIDVLSRQYKINKDFMSDQTYRELNEFNYEYSAISTIFNKIWDKSYNIICNANNIIKNIEDKDPTLFKEKEIEKNLIKGEALAVRAFMHFDLLRLFAPAPINDDGGNYIPYVNEYGELKPHGTNVSECIKDIISDLLEAEKLTESFDTTEMGRGLVDTGLSRFLNQHNHLSPVHPTYGDFGDVELFFLYRGCRFNNDVIKALLARVYQYSGQYNKAEEYALQLMNLEGTIYDIYRFDTKGIEHSDAITDWDNLILAWDQKSDLKMRESIIFAAHNSKLHEETSGHISYWRKHLENKYAARYFSPDLENQKTFFTSDDKDESADDVRYKYLIFNANENMYPISGKWYVSEAESTAKSNVDFTPLIRLSEMYYIAAESEARAGDFAKAKEYLQFVRNAYGCTNDITIKNLEDFKRELIQDARREWISEGQLFYLYKRLDASIHFEDQATPRKYKKSECVVPIPVNQSL